MVAGLDRYYQIVRCARDEDQRADRQPDFTQLDVEMSFVEREDVLDVTERCFKQVWKEVLGVELPDFERMSFAEAMDRFGTDKPDVRYGMELTDLSEVFRTTEVKVFAGALEGRGALKAITVPGKGDATRTELDSLVEEAKGLGASGLVWVRVETETVQSPLDRFSSEEERAGLRRVTDA